MALSRLRASFFLLPHRHFSANAAATTTTSTKDKTRAALSLLKSETNPEKILEICRSASLTPEYHLDRIAFSVAVSKLRDSNNFSYVDSFLTELRTTRPDLQTERFAAHSIVLFGEANMLNHAISAFKDYHESLKERRNDQTDLLSTGSVKAFNALLFACVLCKNFDEVKRIYVEFPKAYNIQLNLDSYNTLIKAFSEGGSSTSIYSVLEEMGKKGLKPNATSFGLFIAGLYKEGKFEDVGKALKMMSEDYGIRVGIATYNIRIQSLCKLGRASEARALMEGMFSRGMKPNADTYSHLIHGFSKEGDLDEAKRLLRLMINRGCQPDYDCYVTLIHFLCKGGDFESAYAICKDSIKQNWVPNFGSMKVLVQGLASIGKVDEGKELVGIVKEKFKNHKSTELWDEVEAGLQQ